MSQFKGNKWERFYRHRRRHVSKRQQRKINEELIRPFLEGWAKGYKRN